MLSGLVLQAGGDRNGLLHAEVRLQRQYGFADCTPQLDLGEGRANLPGNRAIAALQYAALRRSSRISILPQWSVMSKGTPASVGCLRGTKTRLAI
jgi:hypothetical protein